MTLQVRVFDVSAKRFKIGDHELNEEEANALYEELGKKLNKPPSLKWNKCDERYSHGPHTWGKDGLQYCSGRSFDAT